MPSEPAYEPIDLSDYVQVVKRRGRLVIGVAVGIAILAAGYVAVQPETYVSTTQLELPDPADTSAQNPAVFSAYVSDQASVISSTEVAEAAAETLDFGGDPQSLVDHLNVEVPEDSAVVEVGFEASSPRRAQRGALAFAEAYVATKRAEGEQSRRGAIQEAQARVDSLTDSLASFRQDFDESCGDADTGNCLGLQNQIATLGRDIADAQAEVRTAENRTIDAGRVLSTPPLPDGPSSPGPARAGLLGLLGGLVLGIAAAFIYERLDPKLREAGEVTHALDIDTLGSIPVFPESRRNPPASMVTLHAPDDAEADAFRRLRASVLIGLDSHSAQVVGITSASAGEGKSTIAANLAVTIAQTGRLVIVVATDLRRPAVGDLFGLARQGPGLAEVLEGQASLGEAITPLSMSLWAIRGGTPTQNPSDLLLSQRMAETMSMLRKDFDLVILDTPPMLAVADAHSLGHVIDGVLLVVSLADATADQITETEDQLERLQIPLLGSITNRVRTKADGYYSYRSPPAAPASGRVRRPRQRPHPGSARQNHRT